ncbi:MAG: hypothetical protein IPK16_29190 [Anaerolineales bacterium]|nr:hypothetical protein [Anaerolineales bacterium]
MRWNIAQQSVDCSQREDGAIKGRSSRWAERLQARLRSSHRLARQPEVGAWCVVVQQAAWMHRYLRKQYRNQVVKAHIGSSQRLFSAGEGGNSVAPT